MPKEVKLYILGTSASVPTKERNLTSAIINYDGENYLFDTPENVQKQIINCSLSILKINNIFITHYHGDHVFGILGLLASMELNNRLDDINIYMPLKNLKDLKNLIKDSKVNFSFKINFKAVKSNFVFKKQNLTISAIKLDHTTSCYGYIFKINDKIGKFIKSKAKKLNIPEGPKYSLLQEGKSIKINNKLITPDMVMDYSYKKKGLKISYLLDTRVLSKIPNKLKETDILVHEATFLNDLSQKAKKVKHSTVSEVSNFSKKLKPKKLILTHFSPRYKDLELIKKESNFKNTVVSKDLDLFVFSDY